MSGLNLGAVIRNTVPGDLIFRNLGPLLRVVEVLQKNCDLSTYTDSGLGIRLEKERNLMMGVAP